MIPISKEYIRRKEMDSVLSSMVEDKIDYTNELIKLVKKSLNTANVYLFRDIENSFRVLFNTLEPKDKKEVIISGLAPHFVYRIIKERGFEPVVVDVSQDTGVFNTDELNSKIGVNTAYVINNSVFGVLYPSNNIKECGVQVIELISSGFGLDKDKVLFGLEGDYTIISLEEDNIVSTMGGALLSFNSDSIKESVDDYIESYPYVVLPGLNSSFAITQLPDLDTFFEKKINMVKAYKDSLLKSGYPTLENQEANIYNLFPVVLKRGLKDAQKYCKKSGVETLKSFNNTVVQIGKGIKAKNAKSLCSRTISFPIYLGMNRDSVALILKLLSTLP